MTPRIQRARSLHAPSMNIYFKKIKTALFIAIFPNFKQRNQSVNAKLCETIEENNAKILSNFAPDSTAKIS